MIQPLKLGFVAVGRSPYDLGRAGEIAAVVRSHLSEAGFILAGPQVLVSTPEQGDEAVRALSEMPLDALLILQGTFTDSLLVMRLAQVVKSPLILWAIPEAHAGGPLRLNSLSGLTMVTHVLTRSHTLYETIYAAPDDDTALEKVRMITAAGRIRRLLRGVLIGRIEDQAAGFDPYRISYYALRHELGVNVVPINLSTVSELARSIDLPDVDEPMADLKARLPGLDGVDPEVLRRSVAGYLALRQIVKEERLDGLAVRCEPEFLTDLGCAISGPLSILISEGVACTCEADVNATVTQLILQWISSSPAFSSEMVSFDESENCVVFWHRGMAPLEMAEPADQARAALHPSAGLPWLMEIPFKPGRVTLARLSYATGEYRLIVAGAEILPTPPNFTGSSGLLRFDLPAGEVLNTILSEGLEHSLSLTQGDHVTALITLAKQLKIPVLRLA